MPVERQRFAKTKALQVFCHHSLFLLLVRALRHLQPDLQVISRRLQAADRLGELDPALLVVKGHRELVSPMAAKLLHVADGVLGRYVRF